MIAQIQMRRGTTAEWAAASPVTLVAGEPGYDTTLKRMKVGDGSTEWAGLEWVDTDTFRNQNLLYNWDWRYNPVNQRGVTGVLSTNGYFYDMWEMYDTGTITVAAGYLTFASGADAWQYIEGLALVGKVVTVSVMVGDVVYSTTGTIPGSSNNAYPLTGFGDIHLGTVPNGHNYVELVSDATRNVQAVKCELGTVSTLAYDPPMDYGTELAKCQRYYQLRSVDNVNATDMRPLMRITNPTIAGSGPYSYSADL